MSVRVSFNLDDADLEHLAAIAQQTQLRARNEPAESIIAGAREVLETAKRAQLAGFVKAILTGKPYDQGENEKLDFAGVGAGRARV